jgi:hypothetical protein
MGNAKHTDTNTQTPAANAASRKKGNTPGSQRAEGGKKGHQLGRTDFGYSAHSY